MARMPAGFRLSATIAVTEVRTQLKPSVTAVSERFALARPLPDSPRSKSGKNTSITAAAAINARTVATFPRNICELICVSFLNSPGLERRVGSFQQARAFLDASLVSGVKGGDSGDHGREPAR